MKMRIYVGLFLFVNSVCCLTSNQIMERLDYINERIDAESKFRRDGTSVLFSEIDSVKAMLIQTLEYKAERKESDSAQSTEITHQRLEEKVQLLAISLKEEEALNARFRQELPELQKRVQALKTKTDKILGSLERIRTRIWFLTDQEEGRQDDFIYLRKETYEIQNNILDFHKQLEQPKAAESENLGRIKNDTKETKENIAHLHTEEVCLENTEIKNNLTKVIKDMLVNGGVFDETEIDLISSKTDKRAYKCTGSSCPETSTPQGNLMTMFKSSPSYFDNVMATETSSTFTPNTTTATYQSCLELYDNGFKTDAVYEVTVEQEGIISVYCDMTTDGGGWTVFQRRQDGSVGFFRDWNDYRAGFGNLTGEFWLGNEYLSLLTNNDEPHELLVELGDFSGIRVFAKYSNFKVQSERLNYRLKVDGYTGNAGDSLSNLNTGYSIPLGPHNGMQFSTKDRDNDKSDLNCASRFKGGWWFNNCFDSHLNAPYQDQPECKARWECITWNMWKATSYALKFTEMKFR